QPKHRREKSHQHDVKRKHVEVDRLEFQQQPLAQCLDGAIDEARHVELVDDLRIAVTLRDVADRNDVDDEQDDVRDIELPDPFGQAGAAHDEAAFDHHPRVDERGGISRNENEQIGGVAETVIPGGDPVHDVVGNMVQEN